MRRCRLRSEQIDILKRASLAYWTTYFGVTTEELRIAVLRVGTRSERVAGFLGKPL